MTRKLLACSAILLFAANSFAQDNTPAPAAAKPAAAKDAQKLQPVDPAIRKLSRRERKDLTAALPEQYRKFLSDVEPIILPQEVDAFLILETDAQREIFIKDFWKRRDQAQGTTNGTFMDQYYARLEEVETRFKQKSSDRARMFLLNGEPQDVVKVDCERFLQPIEIWKYYFIQGMGHEVRLVFYIPRYQNEYRLWIPAGDPNQALGELVSLEATGGSPTEDVATRRVFFEPAVPGSSLSKLEVECVHGDEILRAVGYAQSAKNDLMRIYEPPQINQEDVRKVLRSVVLANPNAPKLTADFSIRYPAKQGIKTDAEMTILVPKSQITLKDVGESKIYSLDVTGEVLRDGQLYENYRYRFDYPAAGASDKLPVIIDRFLRPDAYQARIKVSDPNSGAEAIIEKDLTVPEIFDTPEQRAQKESASQTVSQLKEAVTSGENRLRIVPLPDAVVSGITKIETIATGDAIKSVAFFLDGRKIAIKRQPPYTLDLDFGTVPQIRRIKAVAMDEKEQVLTGDEIAVNTGNDPFRVRIVSPRVAGKLGGRTRVEIAVKVPEGRQLDHVELFYNETRVATMYNEPFVQTVNIPETKGVGYLRAVAQLKEDNNPIEDVVMLNMPEYMEEVNVHLIELPTTVLVNNRPVNDLSQDAFKVVDDGKPVKLAKFEHVKNLPLSLGMAVDTSGSMLYRMAETQKAGAEFFQNVMKKGDKAFVVSFDSEPQLIQKWSPQISDLHAALAKLRAEEFTALYDAVVFSLYNFTGVKGQKALVLLTDGKDTTSKFTFDQALEYARRAAVPIYAIGIGIRGSEADVKYKLNKFCSETGGNAYYIENANDLKKIYGEIQNELRSQYILGFYPPEGVKAGSKWREVNVQVSQGKAKTIRGYYP